MEDVCCAAGISMPSNLILICPGNWRSAARSEGLLLVAGGGSTDANDPQRTKVEFCAL